MMIFNEWYEQHYHVRRPVYVSPEVKRLYALARSLSLISHGSFWGVAIAGVVHRGCGPDEMMTLLRELKEQNADDADVMRNILGTEYEFIIQFSESKTT